MGHFLSGAVCTTMGGQAAGAQTERRSGAGPVRSLRGGKDLTGRLSLILMSFDDQVR
jgi:hypothetical protein